MDDARRRHPVLAALGRGGEAAIPGRWLLLCAAVAVLAGVFIALVPLGGIPHVTDELNYTWQARLFAAGMRTGPMPDNASMWTYPFWVTGSAPHSAFPWGWPLLLALGEVAGAPWLVNPLLAGLLPVLTWGVAQRWSGDPAIARLAALLAALSPGIWLLSGSRMSHTSVLVALLAATLLLAHRRPDAREAPAWEAWVAGAAVAYVVTARQLDAALVGAPLLVWGLVSRSGVAGRLGLLAPPALAAGLVLADNAALTGDPLTFPINEWFDATTGRPGCNRLGLGEDVGCVAGGHTAAKAWTNTLRSAGRLDRFLLGVPGGLLVALVGAWRLRRSLGPAVALSALVVGGYALYWSPGAAYGARFWHPLYIVLPTLLAAGLAPLLKRWAVPLVGAVALAGGSRALPDLGTNYWCADTGFVDALQAEGIVEGVVFVQVRGVRTDGWPGVGVPAMDCDAGLEVGEAFVLNDPAHPTGGLQVRHAPSSLEQTRDFMNLHHPGQPAWLVTHDVATDTRQWRALGVLPP